MPVQLRAFWHLPSLPLRYRLLVDWGRKVATGFLFAVSESALKRAAVVVGRHVAFYVPRRQHTLRSPPLLFGAHGKSSQVRVFVDT